MITGGHFECGRILLGPLLSKCLFYVCSWVVLQVLITAASVGRRIALSW